MTSSALRRPPSRRLLLGVSVAAMASGLAMPAEGQLARLRSAAGTPVAPVPTAPVVPLRPVNMREAQARAQALQSRADQIRGYVTAARDAALAATRGKPADGLAEGGLDPIAAVREAAQLTAAGGAENIAKAQALLATVSAAQDATGLNTWEGAGAPVQSTVDGRTNVSITQTQERALLTWNTFDVGANTTLQFNQKANGTPQTGWTVVNRVANAVAPSTILGQVKADGTVLVLNRAGVIFGQGSQVNLGSLLVSTLEIGNFGRNFRTIQNEEGQTADVFDAITLKERNTEFLQNGLFAGTRTSGTLPSLLFSPLYPEGMNRTDSVPAIEGAVEIDPGASIKSGAGGFVIMAGPTVINAGAITASDGQVSLQGGRIIAATQSTGAATSADPNVRGLILRTIGTVDPEFGSRSNAATALVSTPDDGVVINRGVIDSPRGYLSLGAGLFGSVTNDGLLASTTSVSRNGKISLTGGTVTLGGSASQSQASAIVILPDASTETIPQGTANEPAPFKTSAVEIGARADDPTAIGDGLGQFIPTVFSMEQNAILWAPSANVVIGRDGSTAFNPAAGIGTLSNIDIANGAVIDVSGMKDVLVSSSRNSLEITPVKRNELRDTPNYREVSLTGDFTLNGQTLFVDPRRSGVRADGVAWIGSPLIEAGSLASQIGVTAAELMTKGGNVAMGVNLVTQQTTAAAAPRINIASGATIDFGGGWVHYDAGVVRTSNLLTADGRIVNIGDADPNDIFVGVADGYTSYQPRFGESETFTDPLLLGGRLEAAYDEGRDAGTLVVSGSAITVNGSFFGDAFAGARQLAGARPGSVAGTVSQDPRRLQRTAQDLPSGGYLRIGSLTGASGVGLGGDISVYAGTTSSVVQDGSVALLSDAMLSRAGLSGLNLQTSGGVSFAAGSRLTLADGGTLNVDAGRSITFDGDIRIASGTIRARTYEFAGAPIRVQTLTSIGSPFRADDNVYPVYSLDAELPRPYDITVTGTLSTAGRWVNDYASGMMAQGGAWTDGGTISLTVAPKVFVQLAPGGTPIRDAGDLSGSITIAPEGVLDVSAGGYIAPDRTLNLTARGGAIALINETTYASTSNTITPLADQPGRSDAPIAGANQSVDFTPTDTVTPALVPSERNARVSFSVDSLRGFGFTGGGSFTLVAPEVGLGSTTVAGGANIPLDFFARTGMSGLNVTAFHSTVVNDIFTNPARGNSAFFDTTQFVVRSGETLNLTTTLLPRFLNAFQATSLLSLRSGGDVRSILTPSVPTAAFEQVAANLTLGGLTELVVEAGGAIVGAPGASITTPKLLNEGTIILPGGSITQRTVLPVNLGTRGYGITSLSDVFGEPNANGQWDENAANVAGFVDPVTQQPLTLRELFSRPDVERFLYFTGALAAEQGIVLRDGSVTDLSGVALIDPRAGLTPSGQQIVSGRIFSGGTISTATPFSPSTTNSAFALFSTSVYGSPRYVNVAETSLPPLIGITPSRSIDFNRGSVVKLTGASGLFDQQVSPTAFQRTLQWSDGGTLSIGGGGTFAGALIDARGGAPAATGGTLTWLRPTIREANTPARESGVIAANQIEESGFATFNALGSVTFNGVPSLTLAKAFTVQSAPSTTGAAIADEAAVTISSTGTTRTVIDAPYIRFASRLGTTPAIGQQVDPANGQVSFVASGGIDFVGGVLFDSSIASVSFRTPGDIRFIGVDDRPTVSTELPSLDGRVIAWGDMLFDAGRTYATTGTGNLQRFIEDQRAGTATTAQPYLVAALGDSSITFGSTYLNSATAAPLSAGSYLKIQAATIEQGGYLAAPLGLLEIGSNTALTLGGQTVSATRELSFLAGSVTTVSGAGLTVPYGSTTDLTEYFFSPSVGLPITATPSGQVKLSGVAVDVGEGATVDGRGGGDIFAFEFVSGTGGSRDVLDRINRDAFSANNFDPVTRTGTQYADGRQVYAIVPADQARSIAAFDPIYSADYLSAAGGDLYGVNAGRAITIDSAAGGIPAGKYILMPAHYALLPGAYRVVENVGVAAPTVGTAQTLLDGSVVVGGVFSTAGTGLSESTRRSFTIQSKEVFGKYSLLSTTSGTTAVVAAANAAGITAPRNPLDAARVVIAPLRSLEVAGAFDTTPATGGRGAQFDILGENIIIAPDATVPAPGNALVLTDDALTRLGANSLSIGAERSENKDGTTVLGVVAKSIIVAPDVSLSAPELLLTVGGNNSVLRVSSGATLTATGKLDDAATGNYLIPSLADVPLGYQYDPTGIGSVVRVSSGPERLITRQGDTALRNTLKSTLLMVDAATITGNAVGLDSTQNVDIATAAAINTKYLALGGDNLEFDGDPLTNPLLRRLGAAENLTLYSRSLIGFGSSVPIGPDVPAIREFRFRNLTLDAPGLALRGDAPVDVRLVADSITLRNTAASPSLPTCDLGALACGSNTLFLIADELHFGSGTVRTYGFGAGTSMVGRNGAYVEGKGGFDIGGGVLSIATPFLADRALIDDPRDQPIRPDYTFATTGAVQLIRPAGPQAALPTAGGTPGARIAFGTAGAPVASMIVDGVAVRATAGVIDVRSSGDVIVRNGASLSTPGYTRTFGDNVDSVTVSADGGTVSLTSLNGGIFIGAGATLSADNGVGSAGAINLLASNGRVSFGDVSTAFGAVPATAREGSLTLDAGLSSFDLTGFLSRYGTAFGGDIALRSGVGDLEVGAGQLLRARSVELVADGGIVSVAGTIDTSGVSVTGLSTADQQVARVDGGNVTLYGATGVTLASTGRIDTHTTGYSSGDTRQASGGDVTLGVGVAGGAITLAAGSTIDVGARRPGDRLVAQIVKDPATLAETTVYRYAAGDTGGDVSFRAPVIEAEGADLVDVRLHGAITGANEVTVEGYKVWNLDQIASDGVYSGVDAVDGGVSLDLSQTRESTGKLNFLTDNFRRGGFGSVVNFIRSFNVQASDGSSLEGIRLRPGIELTSNGNVSFATNWNLGAGILDQQAAIADGLLVAIPELGTDPAGNPYYAVAPGREADLIGNYVNMIYRVGGRASGEAAIVTVRARGTLDVSHSISDGFFSFGDRTDPGYMSYQLGGGDRTVAPAVIFTCGAKDSVDCGDVKNFDKLADKGKKPEAENVVTISLANPVAGSDLSPGILAPYSAAANSAAALGSGEDGAGDPLGGAELFPLLEDGTRAIRSTSLRLVGGADAKSSANPLHVDRATGASVKVSGETSYQIFAETGKSQFAGDLELQLRPSGDSAEFTPISVAPENFIDAVVNSENTENLNPNKADGYYTVLKWGDSGQIAKTTRERAQAFFAENFPEAIFQGRPGDETGVAAPLSAVLAFLEFYGPEYSQKIASGEFRTQRPTAPKPINLGAADTAYVGTTVRSGDGSIRVAAARDIDLRRTPDVTYRTVINTTKIPPTLQIDPVLYQVGGNAIYTAGHALANVTRVATATDGTTIAFTGVAAPSVTFDPLSYQPSNKGLYLNRPQLLEGGGSVSLVATTGDVVGRRDVWAEQALGTGTPYLRRTIGSGFTEQVDTFLPTGLVGAADQRWRTGQVGEDTEMAIAPQLFTSGVATFGGGDVSVRADGSVVDLTLAVDTSVTTTDPLVSGRPAGAAPPVLLTFGGGDATVVAGANLVGGQFDLGSGVGRVDVGGDIVSAGGIVRPSKDEPIGVVNELRVRVGDAYVAINAAGTATIGGLGALGVLTSTDPLVQDAGKGYYSALAGVGVTANETVTLNASRPELSVSNFSNISEFSLGLVLPPSLSIASLTGDISFGGDVPRLLYPSTVGQLSLLAGGEIESLALAMSDADPSLLPGAFSVRNAELSAGSGLDFGFGGVFPNTSDVALRLLHNENPTHAADDAPARVYAGGSITGVTLSLAKQARIGAGLDIVDMVFYGQNVRDTDVTRITAGRDIVGTTAFSASQRRPYINGNNFVLGGYGTLSIEAGRNLGPFLNSATVLTSAGSIESFAGGIRTVGNDLNPWLDNRGANISALFGIAKGADFNALQATYLDPANAALLDGDLFVQVSDASGNLSPDRTRPVYAPILAEWLRDKAPAAFAAIFGATPPTGEALATASYARMADLYAAFAGLDNLTRRGFLVDQLYFNELAQTAIPTSPSYQQYVRGYRATQTLFPTSLGYTDNLAPYTTDPATITPDHPLGVPTRDVVNGEPAAAARVLTGNVDLRLATIETERGGDITILGPGGDVLAGSVVRTSDQAARRATLFGVPASAALESGILSRLNQAPISAIPIGFEGVLTLRGGTIRSATDGDFRLNQSRLFTLGGGDITLWSSNGDLNAGQGPRSASSFPPVTVRFDLNGRAEVDSAGSVAGAGIGAFKPTPDSPNANIILVAPVGEVDAGDAGVRASGNVFVAAARVANADNFSAGGDISGVPSATATAGAAVPTDAASSVVGAISALANNAANNTDKLSLISVDVLGFLGGVGDDCDDEDKVNGVCPTR